ncbi:MAG: DUF6777 domain-containing protein [Ilumatobacter sp.]
MSDAGDRDDLGIQGLGSGTRIGSGGSAAVYRARQDDLDRDVAVKILGGVIDQDARRRFDRERRLMGRLSEHEGMVTVHQTGFTDRDEPFIVMPLLGRSLDDEMKDGPLDWARAVEVMADVSRTVGVAHAEGIVHRDLKPGNIMLSSSGRPLVADFGIARIVDSKTNLEATMLTLTPAYSPPEALETTVADPSTDIYSLGATLFALIAGHPPYCEPGREQTLMTLMRSIVDSPAPSVGDRAPAGVQAVIDRAMAKAPADRFGSADEMADALDALTSARALAAPAGVPATVVPPAPVAPSVPGEPSGGGRGRILAAVAVVVVLLIAAVGVLVAQSGGDDETATPESLPTDAAQQIEAEADDPEPDDGGDPVSESTLPATTEAVLVVEGGEVFLLPFDDDGGEVAFTSSVSNVATAALKDFVRSGGTATAEVGEDDPEATPDSTTAVTGRAGTDDGVFAGTQGVAPCQPEDLVGLLDPDAPETLEWARVLDVEISDIPEFVDGLTATVLTADTRITDHELIDGVAVPRQVVLQVGTGVLIDEFGAPRVRCASGSPLTLPEPVEGNTSYVGSGWDEFDPADTVVVVPGPDPVEEFVLTDVEGGEDFIRPVGSSGATDRPLLPGEVLATGAFTSFPEGADVSTFNSNEFNVIFRPEGGDVTGDFGYNVTFKGITIDVSGTIAGTYDPATGAISGTADAVTDIGVGAGGATATLSAIVDPVAGTIIGDVTGDVDGRGTFELTFTPYES